MWKTCYQKKAKKNKFSKEKALRAEKEIGTRETRKLTKILRFFPASKRYHSLLHQGIKCARGKS